MDNCKSFEFAHTVASIHPFGDTVERLYESLKDEGFGILFDIDARETLMKKTGKDIGKYRIVGACSPRDALEVLETDKRIGTMLPCSMAVYESSGRTFVSFALPSELFPDGKVGEIGKDVERRLVRAVERAAEGR